jgi:hypothetical protein
MIKWNKSLKRYESEDRPAFSDGTREDVLAFQKSVTQAFSTLGSASPYDRHVSTLPVSQSGTPNGTNLDHHVSISAIETMVVNYLNGDVSMWVFLNFVGHIVTPSWLSLADSLHRGQGRVLTEWTQATIGKFALVVKRYQGHNETALATKANELCDLLNSAQQNLRFGDATSNMSINNDLDARLAHGWRLEPVALIEMAWSKATGRPMLAAETCSFLNGGYAHMGDKAKLSIRDAGSTVGVAQNWAGGVAMSESMTTIATTKSGKFNPVKGAHNPAVSPLRGNIPGLVYSPLGRDTLLNLFAIAFLYIFVMWGLVPLLRS